MIDLTKYDIIVALDKAGSMGTKDCPGGKSRWAYAQESVEALARKAEEFDDNGITVIPFANNFKVYDGVTANTVHQVFTENEPNGGTDTAKVLDYILSEYVSKRPIAKPIIVLCVTDGEPNDQKAVAKVITKAANAIESDDEIGIQFIQIGTDATATKFLKSLDDDLVSQGAKFDIVDTKTCDEIESMSMTDVFIQALTD